MSLTPPSTYSPSILDNENVISVEHEQSRLHEWNSEKSDENPHITPFFYSQGNYKSYFEGLSNKRDICENLLTGKKRKSSLGSSSSSSYIVRRGGGDGDGGYLIKLEVHELKDSKDENDYSDSDSDKACVSVQYVVHETYDDIMDATKTLIKKIGKKLCDSE